VLKTSILFTPLEAIKDFNEIPDKLMLIKNIDNKKVDETHFIRNEIVDELEILEIDTLPISAAIIKKEIIFCFVK